MAEKKHLAVFVLSLAVFAAAVLPGTADDAEKLCGILADDFFGQCGELLDSIDGPVVDPSPACCGVIKKIDMRCICSQVVPPGDEYVAIIKKGLYFADKCGNPPPKGIKCGDIITAP